MENCTALPAGDAQLPIVVPTGQLALTGPAVRTGHGHLPVRGDLAHIKLAGHLFVPHYAAPMPHAVTSGGADLHISASPDAAPVCTLPPGAVFDVLDIAGGWCWGQYGENGPVGYVVARDLEPIAP